MDFEKIIKLYAGKKGGIIGAVIGIVLAILFIWLGPFKTIFIVICGGIGYYIGLSVFQGKNLFKAIIDKIIPPGTYR